MKKEEMPYDALFEKTAAIMSHGLVLIFNNAIQFVNPAFLRIFGYATQDEILGKSFCDFVCENKKAECFDLLRSLLASSQDETIQLEEVTCLSKNKNKLLLSVTLQKYSVDSVLLTVEDVSDVSYYKKTFKAYHNSLDPIFFIEDGVFVDCNKATEYFFGFSREQIIGFGFDKISPPIQPDGQDSNEKALFQIDKAYKEGVLVFEWAFLKKDGKQFFARISLIAIDNQLYTIIKDISKELSLKTKIKKIAEDHELAFNYLPVGVFWFDKDGIITKMNDKFVEIIGSSREILTNFSLLNQLQDKQLKKLVRNVLEGKKEQIYQDYYKSVTAGKVIPVRVTLNSIPNHDHLCGVGIVEDITSQIEYERALQVAKEKAEESDHLKSAFLANMSHEIRTPMNSIIGFARLIEQFYDKYLFNIRKQVNQLVELSILYEDVVAKDSFKNLQKSLVSSQLDENKNRFMIVHHSCEMLLMLINDIIDIAKIEAGQLQTKKEIVYLKDMLKKVYQSIQHESKDIDFYFSISDQKIVFLSDEYRIIQILTNFLKNAFKFTKQGFVELGCQQDNDRLLFFVKDTGTGISKNKQKLIFNRFEQLDNSVARKYGGTGLGLAICKGLVKLLSGDIWVESEGEGFGSTFYLSIPYILPGTSSVDNAPDTRDLDHKFIDNQDWSSYTVLIAEDIEYNLMLLKQMLLRTNIKMYFAYDGQETIDIFDQEKETIDLVLLDIKMPKKDGYDVLRHIRSCRSNIPVIMQTAYAMQEDKKKVLSLGANEYITKPIKRDLLFQKMAQFLESGD